jgi:hypothetical protein
MAYLVTLALVVRRSQKVRLAPHCRRSLVLRLLNPIGALQKLGCSLQSALSQPSAAHCWRRSLDLRLLTSFGTLQEVGCSRRAELSLDSAARCIRRSIRFRLAHTTRRSHYNWLLTFSGALLLTGSLRIIGALSLCGCSAAAALSRFLAARRIRRSPDHWLALGTRRSSPLRLAPFVRRSPKARLLMLCGTLVGFGYSRLSVLLATSSDNSSDCCFM